MALWLEATPATLLLEAVSLLKHKGCIEGPYFHCRGPYLASTHNYGQGISCVVFLGVRDVTVLELLTLVRLE